MTYVLFTKTLNIDLIEVKCRKCCKFMLVCMKEMYNVNSLSKAIYVSEQLCIRWHRTGAYYIQLN